MFSVYVFGPNGKAPNPALNKPIKKYFRGKFKSGSLFVLGDPGGGRGHASYSASHIKSKWYLKTFKGV